MIFVVEDEPLLRRSIAEYMRASGQEVEEFSDAESALVAAKESPPDLVLSDLQLPGMSGLQLVESLSSIDPSIVRILMTAHASIETAVRAMRSGCYEYLEKPVDLEKLARLVARALKERRAGVELDWLRGQRGLESPTAELLGESESMRFVKRQIETLGKLGRDAPTILVTGETGVGKGLVVRAIHVARFGGEAPYIEVSCAALPATLIEGELFGYERSAFTDAKQAKPGLFEAASGGTLFLDEIGELPVEIQAKLLTVVESKRVRRLGAVREREVSAAIVCATNVDLPAAVSEGRFRSDLYHRLAAYTLSVPPLRARGDDVVLLARAFLARAARRYRKSAGAFSADAEARIRSASWPGNVRELQYAIERTVLLLPDGATTVAEADLYSAGAVSRTFVSEDRRLVADPWTASPSKEAPKDARTWRMEIDARDPSRIEVTLPEDGVSFDAIERAILAEALDRTEGNVVQAARLLSLKRDAVRYRMRRLGLAAEAAGGRGDELEADSEAARAGEGGEGAHPPEDSDPSPSKEPG